MKDPIRFAGGSSDLYSYSDSYCDLDLVTANTRSNDVTVLLGNGDGTFRPLQPLPVRRPGGLPTGYPTWVAVADVNQDGALDLVVVKSNSREVVILFGTGEGTFLAIK